MLKQIFDFISGVIFLVRDTAENKRKLQELATQTSSLHQEILKLSDALRRIEERERLEREKFVLQVENALLRERPRIAEKPRRKKG